MQSGDAAAMGMSEGVKWVAGYFLDAFAIRREVRVSHRAKKIVGELLLCEMDNDDVVGVISVNRHTAHATHIADGHKHTHMEM